MKDVYSSLNIKYFSPDNISQVIEKWSTLNQAEQQYFFSNLAYATWYRGIQDHRGTTFDGDPDSELASIDKA